MAGWEPTRRLAWPGVGGLRRSEVWERMAPSLHVPLVIYDPVHAFPAHRVPGIVRDIDVVPTRLWPAGPADAAGWRAARWR